MVDKVTGSSIDVVGNFEECYSNLQIAIEQLVQHFRDMQSQYNTLRECAPDWDAIDEIAQERDKLREELRLEKAILDTVRNRWNASGGVADDIDLGDLPGFEDFGWLG